MNQNQEKNPQDKNPLAEIYPTPQEPKPLKKEVVPSEKTKKRKEWLLSILIAIAIVLIGAIIFVGFKFVKTKIKQERSSRQEESTSKKQSTASPKTSSSQSSSPTGPITQSKKALMQSYVRQMALHAEIYYNEHATYVGWTGDPVVIAEAEKKEAKINIQGLTASTYVVTAKLLNSLNLYCMDKTGFAGEIESIRPDQTTCQSFDETPSITLGTSQD